MHTQMSQLYDAGERHRASQPFWFRLFFTTLVFSCHYYFFFFLRVFFIFLKARYPSSFQVSGTGHAGMEAAIANCIEPGESIAVATSGIWGQRVCDLSERYGGI